MLGRSVIVTAAAIIAVSYGTAAHAATCPTTPPAGLRAALTVGSYRLLPVVCDKGSPVFAAKLGTRSRVALRMPSARQATALAAMLQVSADQRQAFEAKWRRSNHPARVTGAVAWHRFVVVSLVRVS
ncbi:MAG TPA: hypothetical protein VKB57_23680 [Acidimicrobiales bacterium]|nr:hypothetical protein [Acidimicrobiales bacterium]